MAWVSSYTNDPYITSHQSDVRSHRCSHRCGSLVPGLPYPGANGDCAVRSSANFGNPHGGCWWNLVTLTKVKMFFRVHKVSKALYQNLGVDHIWLCFRNFNSWSHIDSDIHSEIGEVLWQVFPLLQGSSPGLTPQNCIPMVPQRSRSPSRGVSLTPSDWRWESLEMYSKPQKR